MKSITGNGFWLVIFITLVCNKVQAQDDNVKTFQPEDVHRVHDVGDAAVSPDGQWVAYSVGTTNVDKDQYLSDIHMVSWDGKTRIQLTHTEDSGENHPRFSPDGKSLAFLAARAEGASEESSDPKTKGQIWILNLAGGEAKRVTEFAGGVKSFEWSPDSNRFVIVSLDPEEEEEEEEKEDGPSHDTPKPIVVDRYQFKQDGVGYLGNRYQRLYVFDLKDKEATLLTPGAFNNDAPNWSPDGDLIAFSSKRQGDPDRHNNSDIYVIEPKANAVARQVTTWEGPDFGPSFSPNGEYIVHLQSGSKKFADYDPAQVAVTPVNGGETTLPASSVDRAISSPQWSRDGQRIYFLLSDDRSRSVASVPWKGGKMKTHFPHASRPGVANAFVPGAKGLLVETTFGQQPAELYIAKSGKALSDHNRELLDAIEFATVEGYDAVSKDGTRVGAMLLKPPGYREGTAYPTIAYIHGGPVGQDGFEFDALSQVLAAEGYLVVNPNYRGSNGRGREFSRAIYADWGNLEIQDIHAVMDKLVEDGLADPERLGIGGWSYGGMNTNYAIATDTRFAAAVSGAGIANMLTGYGTDQYITQYENELGLPWESIEPYTKISYPFYHADRIKTPTLFMCGEKDFNVPLINSEQMYQALRSLNIPTQLVIYPGQYHGLSKPSYVQDRMERMIEWYGRYLSE